MYIGIPSVSGSRRWLRLLYTSITLYHVYPLITMLIVCTISSISWSYRVTDIFVTDTCVTDICVTGICVKDICVTVHYSSTLQVLVMDIRSCIGYRHNHRYCTYYAFLYMINNSDRYVWFVVYWERAYNKHNLKVIIIIIECRIIELFLINTMLVVYIYIYSNVYEYSASSMYMYIQHTTHYRLYYIRMLTTLL